MKYTWKAQSDDGCFVDECEKVFGTQEECYMDMMDHAVNKMKWNVEWDDVMEVNNAQDKDGIIRNGSFLGYEARFYTDKIVHTSYSGTYTYEIVPVADDANNPVEEREPAEITRNRFSPQDEVEHDGVIYIVQDYHYDADADGWVYDLKEMEGDGEMLDIPQDEIKIYIEDIPESIIVEYEIRSGKPRMYVYNLTDKNDCEHFFDDEANIVRTLVKRDKGLSEEDYYEDMPIGDVKKMVLAAMEKQA